MSDSQSAVIQEIQEIQETQNIDETKEQDGDIENNIKVKNIENNEPLESSSSSSTNMINYAYNTHDITNIPSNNHAILKLSKEIHINCVNFSIYHNRRYQYYKKIIFYVFRLPIILLSAINSFLAVGSDGYIEQSTVSVTNAVISLVCGIFTSIELFLNLQKKIESEFTTYKNYYLLSIDAYHFIQLYEFDNDADERKRQIINENFEIIYSKYKELISNSNPINFKRVGFVDALELVDQVEYYKNKK